MILGADGSRTEVPRGAKEALAEVVWDLVAARLNPRPPIRRSRDRRRSR